MKFISIIFASAAMVAAGCSDNNRSDAVYAIADDSTATWVAHDIASTLTPGDAARAFISWMEQAPLERSEYARSLAREVHSAYSADDAARFAATVDSIQRTLPLERQARLLAIGSVPEALAAALLEAPDSSTEIIEMVSRAYRPDSLLSKRFENAISNTAQTKLTK